MKTIRLTKIAHILHFWEFISKALTELNEKAHQVVDLEAVRKTLIWTVPDENKTWCALVVEDEEPVAFVVAYDSTPPFELVSSFQVRWFYHNPGKFTATFILMHEFEAWASQRGVNEYSVTTSRTAGAAIRCFQSDKFGFKRSYTTYTKAL